jgi:RecA/RadA recombinase
VNGRNLLFKLNDYGVNMPKTASEESKKKIGKINIDKLVSSVRSQFGKDKSLAAQVSTGRDISRPARDDEFVHWKDSPWFILTGIIGIPFGRVVQIAGRPDSGKSTHAMQFMKNAQDQGVLVILWDAENKFMASRYDKYFGGDSSQLLITTSKMILAGGNQIEKMVHAAKEQDPDIKILIVWDSVGGTLAANEEENSLGNSKQMAAASKENAQVMRALVRLMEKYKNKETNEETIAGLLINQVYANIGAPGQKESGGQKVEFFSSIILQLTRKSDLTKVRDGVKRKIGIVTRAKVKKNHLFDGEDSIAELDLIITAGGIKLLKDIKVKNEDWTDSDEEVEADGEEEN